jgi:quinol-cytochrome oxidoreductase complex cytochrome b subunit
MSKLYWIFVIVICALALWGTEEVLSQTTTILGPDGSIIICQVTPNGVVICG